MEPAESPPWHPRRAGIAAVLLAEAGQGPGAVYRRLCQASAAQPRVYSLSTSTQRRTEIAARPSWLCQRGLRCCLYLRAFFYFAKSNPQAEQAQGTSFPSCTLCDLRVLFFFSGRHLVSKTSAVAAGKSCCRSPRGRCIPTGLTSPEPPYSPCQYTRLCCFSLLLFFVFVFLKITLQHESATSAGNRT